MFKRKKLEILSKPIHNNVQRFISNYYPDKKVRYTNEKIWSYQLNSNGEYESGTGGAIGLLNERFLFLKRLVTRPFADYESILYDILYKDIRNVCIYSEKWKPHMPMIDTFFLNKDVLILDLLDNSRYPHLFFEHYIGDAEKTCSVLKQLKKEFNRLTKHV